MNLWLRQLKKDVPADLHTPVELARFELGSALPGLKTELRVQASMGDAYRIDPLDDGSFLLTGGSTVWLDAKRISNGSSAEEIRAWAESLGLGREETGMF